MNGGAGAAGRSFAAALRAGAEALGLELAPQTPERLLRYLDLVDEWNRAYNLTAVRERDQQLTRHLLDSLAVLPWLVGPRVADVGSGAGLPGIVLAVAAPQLDVTLVDSVARKTRFLRHVVRELELANVEVHTGRCEDYRPAEAFDTVVARAFAPLPRLIELAGHLCAASGRILAMKGRRPDTELAGLAQAWRVVEVVRLEVPGLAAERHLVVLEPSG